MELRFLLIPMALAVCAAMQPQPITAVTPTPQEDPGKIAAEQMNTPAMPRFDHFYFGDGSSGRVDVDMSHLRGKPPLVVQIWPSGSGHSLEGWYGFLLHQHNYRLARVFPEDEASGNDGNALAASLARGIAALVAKADRYGFDPRRIIITSSDVGGDIAALLATDPDYFEQAGIPFASAKAVIILDGAGFDLPAYLATLSHYRRREVEALVGADPAVQARISALRHAEPSNAPAFLLEVARHDKKSEAQAETLASALTQAGSQARIEHYDRPRTHDGDFDYAFGFPGDPDTAPLLRFLNASVGRP